MWKNNEQRQHLRARLAPTEAPTEQQEPQGEVWHEPMSLTGLVEDMTEEIETRRADQSRLLTLESWLRSMPDAVVVVRAGRIESTNAQAESLLGDLAQRGQPLLGVAEPEFHEGLAAHARPRDDASPTVVRLIGEVERFVEVSSRALDESPDTRLLVFRDVTARLHAEHRAEAAERLASVGRLAAGVAHEINNPMAYVSMNIELLREGLDTLSLPPPLEDEVRQKLDDAYTGASRVTEIVSQLRLYANARTSVARGGRVREAVALAQQLSRFAMADGVEVETKVPEKLPKVAMSVGPLSQVLINLLVNAGDAIADSENQTGRVVITAREARNGIQIYVQDDGPGIPEHQWRTIFEPYFTTKDPGKGTGMGLSIVRSLIHQAGGTISLRKVRSGACFQIELPFWESGDLEELDTSETATGQPKRRKLLIIDDEPALVRALSARLSSEFDIVTACDGMDAKRQIEAGLYPAVILCDVVMPNMDGNEFHDWLGDFDRTLQSRMVIMTGGTLSPDRADFLRDSERPVLTKPLSMAHLQETMQKVEA